VLAGFDWTADQLGIIMGCGIPIVAIIGFFWYKTAKTTSENELKRTLVVAARPGGRQKDKH
jgi:hypothetical protein